LWFMNQNISISRGFYVLELFSTTEHMDNPLPTFGGMD
jgi:hypothetical protein